VDEATIDGEIVIVISERTDFSGLQADLVAKRTDRMLFYAFDLLHHDGYNPRKVPLIERKRYIKALFDAGLAAPAPYSEHMTTGGQIMFAAAAKLNWKASFRNALTHRAGQTATRAG
jgi:bifunctional non-homologous end joining protein LigD